MRGKKMRTRWSRKDMAIWRDGDISWLPAWILTGSGYCNTDTDTENSVEQCW